MADVNRGFTGSFGLGTETVWGTPVPRTRWLRAFEVGLQKKPITKNVPTLGAKGAASTNYTHQFQEREDAGGTVVWPFGYNDGSLSMLDAIMGSTVDAGVGPFTHTFTLASPASLVGFTIEQIHGAVTSANANMAQVFEGGRVSSLELACRHDDLMIASAEIIGQTGGSLGAVPTPTYGAPSYILPNHMAAGQMTFNSVSQTIKGWRLRIDRGLQRNQELGSLFTSEPIETRLMVTLEVDFLFQSGGWHSVFYAGTQHDVTWSFTGTSPLAAAFTLHNAKLLDVDHRTSDPGGIPVKAQFQGYSDDGSGDQGLGIVITNSNALFTAN